MKTALAALLLLSAATTPPLAGQGDDETSRRTLASLKGVHVLVADIADDVQREGLREDQIQTDVELKLRQAGITVLSREESFPAVASGIAGVLFVNLQAHKCYRSLYAYTLAIEVQQEVRLIRNPTAEVLTPTWLSGGSSGRVGPERFSSVRDDVRDQVDQFINAYLAANRNR